MIGAAATASAHYTQDKVAELVTAYDLLPGDATQENVLSALYPQEEQD